MMMTYLELVSVVNDRLKNSARLHHTLQVVSVSEQLAIHYGAHVINAKIAALLHDVTKEEPDNVQHDLILSYFSQDELMNWPKPLWHALSAVAYAHHQLGIDDTDILNAIQYHTSGRPHMSLLEKIIYVADFIEPTRSFDNHAYYEMAFVNLDYTLASIMKSTLNHLEQRQAHIFKLTYEAYQFYKSFLEE